jgi:CRISPR/Cas system-associated exonuclease Cas4 (RecB family)
MSKNLLKEIMLKKTSIKQKEVDFDLTGLVDIIKSGYTKPLIPKQTIKYSFAPSSLAYGHGKCPRYWYFAFEGSMFEDNTDAQGAANRSNGTFSHIRIQNALIESGITKIFQKENSKTKEIENTTEFDIKNENPPIYGHGDGIINWNGKEVIIEIKTAPSEVFEYRKLNKKAKKDHIIQLLIYMKILKHKHGIIIYENKNNHELLPIAIYADDYYRKWTDNAFNWMINVRASWMKNELPIKNYRSNSKICKQCPVKKICDQKGSGVVKIASMEELSETV